MRLVHNLIEGTHQNRHVLFKGRTDSDLSQDNTSYNHSLNITLPFFHFTLLGCPIRGLFAHLCLITSRIRCFCPLYVVRMAILSAGYPMRRMYIKMATAYSASPRFYSGQERESYYQKQLVPAMLGDRATDTFSFILAWLPQLQVKWFMNWTLKEKLGEKRWPPETNNRTTPLSPKEKDIRSSPWSKK